MSEQRPTPFPASLLILCGADPTWSWMPPPVKCPFQAASDKAYSLKINKTKCHLGLGN